MKTKSDRGEEGEGDRDRETWITRKGWGGLFYREVPLKERKLDVVGRVLFRGVWKKEQASFLLPELGVSSGVHSQMQAPVSGTNFPTTLDPPPSAE